MKPLGQEPGRYFYGGSKPTMRTTHLSHHKGARRAAIRRILLTLKRRARQAAKNEIREYLKWSMTASVT